MRSICLLLIFVVALSQASVLRHKRQTFQYDPELMAFAQPHPGTRIITGYVQRYAPQDWPSWYTRTMMKWGGDSRMSPYYPNDPRFADYMSNSVKNQ